MCILAIHIHSHAIVFLIMSIKITVYKDHSRIYQYIKISNVKADANKTVNSGSYYVAWSFLDPFCDEWLLLDAVVETTDVGVPYRCGLVQSDHVREQVVDGQVCICHLQIPSRVSRILSYKRYCVCQYCLHYRRLGPVCVVY